MANDWKINKIDLYWLWLMVVLIGLRHEYAFCPVMGGVTLSWVTHVFCPIVGGVNSIMSLHMSFLPCHGCYNSIMSYTCLSYLLMCQTLSWVYTCVFCSIMSGLVLDMVVVSYHIPLAMLVSYRGSLTFRCLNKLLFELEINDYLIFCLLIAFSFKLYVMRDMCLLLLSY